MTTDNRTLYVMRGFPGSGKSTWIRRHAPTALAFSADDYFTGSDGSYKWDPEELGSAHAWAVAGLRIAMRLGITPLALDNCNLLPSEAMAGINSARDNGYRIVLVNMTTPWDISNARNVHGVPFQAGERLTRKRADGDTAFVWPVDKWINVSTEVAP